jgi:2,4-dienoyl-CoA reductase (NADPH2)
MSTVEETTMAAYPNLCAPLQLGPKQLRNHVFQAPMSVCYADEDGYVTAAMVEHYARRSQGGVAMVITENLAVNLAGRQLPKQAMISEERFLPGLTELACEIKRHGAVAVVQIVHSGRYAGPWQEYGARRRLAPSAVPFPLPPDQTVAPQEITREEIAESIEAFATATSLARRAGFDGVEIHGAQGFLISSFQSPRMNLRTDEYGGSFVNRCRFALEVVDAVVAAAGPDMLVGYHVMSDEMMDGGWTVEDAVGFGRELAPRGVHFAMPIATTFESLRAPANLGLFNRHMFQHHLAVRLSEELEIPVLANGKLGDPTDAEGVLERGEAVAVGLARPLLADPDWMKKVVENRAQDICTCACDPPTCLRTQMTGSMCDAWPEAVRDTGHSGYNHY